MLVTINTDASHNEQTNTGSYAIKIFSNSGIIEASGTFKNFVKGSTHAEFFAIINALHLVKSQDWIITKIVINTDSRTIVDLMKNPSYKGKMKKYKNKVIEYFDLSILSFRHVEAHSNIEKGRNKVNNELDKIARSKLRNHPNNKK